MRKLFFIMMALTLSGAMLSAGCAGSTTTTTPPPSSAPSTATAPAPAILTTQILVDGLTFPECPRWHDGKLWFSDMRANKVMTVDAAGKTEVVAEVPNQPGGLGWLPDGRLLIVSMKDMRLLRLDPEGLVQVADLSGLAKVACNDMVVDKQGNAYIGHFGFDPTTYVNNWVYQMAEIIMVKPDGEVRVAARGVVWPNGSAITPDGRTLIVVETFLQCLTAFDIGPDGSLSGKRAWAYLSALGNYANGMCLDSEGGAWVAVSGGIYVVRMVEGGRVTHMVRASGNAVACALGGPDMRTLYVCTAPARDEAETVAAGGGRIETVRVEIPGVAGG